MGTIDTNIAALNTTLRQNSGPGITNYGGAIAQLQAAGGTAVSSIGPAIDAIAAGDPKVMQITQWAWQKNGNLAAVPSGDGAAQSDLDSAAAMLGQMASWYGQAYRLAQSLHVAPLPFSQSAPVKAVGPVFTPPQPQPTAYAPVFHPMNIPMPAPIQQAPTPIAVTSSATASAMTSADAAATGLGALVGFGLGTLALGLKLGGPVGFIAGAALGYGAAKMAKV